jgi:hypothetical protein
MKIVGAESVWWQEINWKWSFFCNLLQLTESLFWFRAETLLFCSMKIVGSEMKQEINWCRTESFFFASTELNLCSGTELNFDVRIQNLSGSKGQGLEWGVGSGSYLLEPSCSHREHVRLVPLVDLPSIAPSFLPYDMEGWRMWRRRGAEGMEQGNGGRLGWNHSLGSDFSQSTNWFEATERAQSGFFPQSMN